MRKTHFLLIGMLLISCITVNLTAPINADELHGTRSPDAGVEITPPSNKTGAPTETVSYSFIVNNTGDQTDNFTVSAVSENSWDVNTSSVVVGPLASNESTVVTVNITIPMGEPANTVDNLTFKFNNSDIYFRINQLI